MVQFPIRVTVALQTNRKLTLMNFMFRHSAFSFPGRRKIPIQDLTKTHKLFLDTRLVNPDLADKQASVEQGQADFHDAVLVEFVRRLAYGIPAQDVLLPRRRFGPAIDVHDCRRFVVNRYGVTQASPVVDAVRGNANNLHGSLTGGKLDFIFSERGFGRVFVRYAWIRDGQNRYARAACAKPFYYAWFTRDCFAGSRKIGGGDNRHRRVWFENIFVFRWRVKGGHLKHGKIVRFPVHHLVPLSAGDFLVVYAGQYLYFGKGMFGLLCAISSRSGN